MKCKTFTYLLLALFMAAGALALGGCAAEDTNASAGANETNCDVNTHCPNGQICREGLCSVRASAQTELDFRFIPPSTAGFLPQHIDNVRVRTDQPLDFGLERAITVNSGNPANNGESGGQSGGIRYANNPLQGPSGTLLFRPAGIDDQLFSHEARVDRGDFNARITPGRYALTFVPDDRTELPKKTWPEEVFESNTYLLRTLRSAQDLIVVEGTLSRNVTLSGGTTQEELVDGARVYATSADGRHTSTVATTDSGGNFKLRVEPGTGTYDIFVVPTSANPDILHLEDRAAFEVTEETCIPTTGGEGNPCKPTVSLGAYPAEPVAVQVRLEVPVDYEGDASFEGTNIVVTGTVAAGTYTRRHEVEFKEQQQLWGTDILLYPAAWSVDEMPQYSVEIVPPVRSPFSRTEVVVEGQIGLDAFHHFEVGMKQRVVGQVVDAQRGAIGAAKLDFRAVPGDGDTHDGRVISVTTDQDGYFEAWLDEADYEVFIVPPPATGQPRTLSHLEVSSVSVDEEAVFELPRPAVVVGSVVGPKGAEADQFGALADVMVEAYKVLDGRTFVMGQARTDSNGEFRMVIGAQL